jgi:hypothetical protein
MAKLDHLNGDIIWQSVYGSPAYNTSLFAVKELPDGDLIAIGQSYQVTTYGQGVFLKTNPLGDSLWMRHYYYADSLMNDGQGTLRDVMPTPDGGFVAVGAVTQSASGNNPPSYNRDIWVIKVDSMGCLVPGCDTVTGIISQVTNMQGALSIAPIPADQQATLSWQLPARFLRSAQLTVVGSTGAIVYEEPMDLAAGSQRLDVSTWPVGMYYVHVVQEGSWLMGCKLVVE